MHGCRNARYDGAHERCAEAASNLSRHSALDAVVRSLSENCDLAVVRRAVGHEAFGLFHFYTCDGAAAAQLLKTRLKDLFDADDLEVVGVQGERWVKPAVRALRMG